MKRPYNADVEASRLAAHCDGIVYHYPLSNEFLAVLILPKRALTKDEAKRLSSLIESLST